VRGDIAGAIELYEARWIWDGAAGGA